MGVGRPIQERKTLTMIPWKPNVVRPIIEDYPLPPLFTSYFLLGISPYPTFYLFLFLFLFYVFIETINTLFTCYRSIKNKLESSNSMTLCNSLGSRGRFYMPHRDQNLNPRLFLLAKNLLN